MGMGYGANYGYVTGLTEELLGKIGIPFDEFIGCECYDNHDPVKKKIADFFGVNCTDFDIYYHHDGDRYDDLEGGEYYILWVTDILFQKITLPKHQEIQDLSRQPIQHALWVTFG